MKKKEMTPGMSKVPPHDVEVEAAILGAMLMNPNCIVQAKSSLTIDDFYKQAHALIFKAILGVGKNDAKLIAHKLTQDKNLETVGGKAYIGELAEAVSTSANFEYHREILKNLSHRRKVIYACMTAGEQSYDLSIDLNDALSTLKADLRETQTEEYDYRVNKELVQAVFKDIKERANDNKHHVGILSGFKSIDLHLNGFEDKTLIYIIGRPGMGKTALAVNIADNMALANDGLVLFFSLEMGDEQITRRRLSAKSKVNLSHIRSGYIQASQWPDLVEAADKIAENTILVIDRAKYKTFERLAAITDTLSLEHKIAAIFVDHIQLMTSKKNFSNRHLEISYISNNLKSIAKGLSIPVIALCQLRRDVETRRNKRPQLSDMKESGDLEQDADVIIGIYREEKDSDIMEIAGLKGRDVGTWQDKLLFDRFIQKISDPETV